MTHHKKEQSYYWSHNQLYSGSDKIASIIPIILKNASYEDEIMEQEQGVYLWKRRFKILDGYEVTEEPLVMELQANFTPTFAMIPGVSYNGNKWGNGKEPKGFEIEGKAWSFAYHRTSIAGATYSEDERWSVGLFGIHEGDDFACALVPKHNSAIHRLIIPLEESPLAYTNRDDYEPSYQEKRSFPPGEIVCFSAILVVHPRTETIPSWNKMLEVSWNLHQLEMKPWFSAEKVWELGVHFAKESLWVEEGIFKGFSVGLTLNDGKWEQRKHWKYEAGWCGQNISIANSLLFDYLKTGNSNSLYKGITTLDCWAQHARMDNGLLRCHFDYIMVDHQPYPEVQDACNLGMAALDYFEAYELAEKCGMYKPEYREVALGICQFAMRSQNSRGSLGKSWNNEGDLIDPEGTIGAFLLPALIRAYATTRDAMYLEAAEKGYGYYMKEFIENGFTTAGALDTYCVDKESAAPLLDTGLALYNITQNHLYLQWAEYSASYLATWQWHHTVSYPDGSALHALSYDTFGGTSVSTQHHHLDPYGVKFINSWLQLSELTGNGIWRERAKAVWTNGTIGISNGTLQVMGHNRPAGSQDEGFFHTRWGAAFEVSQWLVAWPTGFRLETLRHLPDWSVLN